MTTLRYFMVFLTLTFYSCHFFEPKDNTGNSSLKVTADLQSLDGSWKATDATYDLLKEKKYPVASVSLKLNKDSTFLFSNLPDCINSPFGDPIKGELVSAKGKWHVYNFGEKWKLQLNFEKSEVFDKTTFLDFDIVRNDSKLRVCQYVGDPDEANVLEFEKPK